MLLKNARSSFFAFVLFCFIAVLFLGTRADEAVPSPAPKSSPELLAVYEPWFGQPDHLNVGYSSHDPAVLEQQVKRAHELGIQGFVVDWYGSRRAYIDTTFTLLQHAAAASGFKVALMYDEPDDAQDPTETAIASLAYAYTKYIGPAAPDRAAYLTYQDRPVIFIWPRRHGTDWARVRQSVALWDTAPLFIFEDDGTGREAQFDGVYAWVRPGSSWSADGQDWGRAYLNRFYRKMSTTYENKIAVGAAWPGFDDRKASWSQNRYMDARCGRTLDDTLRAFRRYYNSSNPLPFLLIATWNDYEEGTAIERGINTCI